MCCRALGANSRFLTDIIALNHLWQPGQVLPMSAVYRLPLRTNFARAGPGWKKWRGGQAMTWCRGVNQLVLVVASVAVSRFRVWGPKDENCC